MSLEWHHLVYLKPKQLIIKDYARRFVLKLQTRSIARLLCDSRASWCIYYTGYFYFMFCQAASVEPAESSPSWSRTLCLLCSWDCEVFVYKYIGFYLTTDVSSQFPRPQSVRYEIWGVHGAFDCVHVFVHDAAALSTNCNLHHWLSTLKTCVFVFE